MLSILKLCPIFFCNINFIDRSKIINLGKSHIESQLDSFSVRPEWAACSEPRSFGDYENKCVFFLHVTVIVTFLVLLILVLAFNYCYLRSRNSYKELT